MFAKKIRKVTDRP